MSAKFHDALYMCTIIRCPSFLVTFTVTPKWPAIIEVIRETSPTATSSDRADIIARLFRLKLDELIHDLMHKHIFGRIAGMSMAIEYQKRMLPRARIVVIIHPDGRHKIAEDIDKLISAEIPREPTDADNEETREYLIRASTAVVTHMDHGPCDAENPIEFLTKSVQGAA
jgi:hypothetical protein